LYLRNSWYVIGRSNELVEKPMARRALDEPIVLYRCKDGSVAALEDHCPHRHFPLSMGIVTGNFLRCGYHGMTFDRNGKCVGVPSQPSVPPGAKVKSYPAAERFGWIWVWMGDHTQASVERIPDFHQLTDPKYSAVGNVIRVEASYNLLVDNLLDLSHVGYVHRSTIGADGMGEKGKLTVERTSTGVTVKRLVPDVAVPPVYLKSGFPEGKRMDRYQIIEFISPSFIRILAGGAEAGTGALEGKTDHGFNFWVMNAVTPETAGSSHYFWSVARTHSLGDPATDTLIYNATAEAFDEDRIVLEAQQKLVSTYGDSWTLALRQDAGSIEARRIREQSIKAETEAPR
jgi:phenylpropionate dioxygenase-like ring-hydroxylating dioxygenase large terminal subunit